MAAVPPLPTIPQNHLIEEKILGKGSFGIVYFGKWKEQTVAIKRLFQEAISGHSSKEFQKEAEILWRCGESPYIVKLLGVCSEPDHQALVFEYMQMGSLYDVLKNQEIDLPWGQVRFRIARDIAKGIAYLHDREMIHRDIKSPNILLDANYNAKLSDFGLIKVRFTSETKLQSITGGQLVGTLYWLAPELFTLSPVYTKASDVYAYAMVLWEIGSRKIPYKETRVNIEEHVKNGERLPIPEVAPEKYAKLIEQGWHQNPLERPGIRHFVLQLEQWALPSAAPSIVPRAASASPRTSARISPSPQIKFVPSDPTVETLQVLIVQLLDHKEMKEYSSLSTCLNVYLDKLIDAPGSQILENGDLKIYNLAKIMISPDKKISRSIATLLERALNPKEPGTQPVASPVVPRQAPIVKSSSLLSAQKVPASSSPEDLIRRKPQIPPKPIKRAGEIKQELEFADLRKKLIGAEDKINVLEKDKWFETNPDFCFVELSAPKLLPSSEMPVTTTEKDDRVSLLASISPPKHHPKIETKLKPEFIPERKAPSIVDSAVLKEAPSLPIMTFGKAKWKEYFSMDVVEPPLPENIEILINLKCPILPTHKVKDTHILVLVPEGLDLNILEKIIKKPNKGFPFNFDAKTRKYFDKFNFYKKLFAESVPNSHWVLMSQALLIMTDKERVEEQFQSLKKRGYEIPHILDGATALSVYRVEQNKDLFSKTENAKSICALSYVEGYDMKSCLFGSSSSGLLLTRDAPDSLMMMALQINLSTTKIKLVKNKIPASPSAAPAGKKLKMPKPSNLSARHKALTLFDVKKWEQYIKEKVGDDVPLPIHIDRILKSPCPFNDKKTIAETHSLIFVPVTIKGEQLTFKSLRKLIEKEGESQGLKFNFIGTDENDMNIINNLKTDRSYWLLVPKRPILEFGGDSLEEQLKAIAKKFDNPADFERYKTPTFMEAAIGISTLGLEGIKTLTDAYTACTVGEKIFYMGCYTLFDGVEVTSSRRVRSNLVLVRRLPDF